MATFQSVIFGMLAGAIVDRLPRKRVMISAELTQMVFAFGFVLLLLLPQTPLWSVFFVAFLSATAGAFFTPARMALLPAVVPPHGPMAANSLGQMTRVLFTVVGTTIAGFLVGSLEQYALVFALVSHIWHLFPILFAAGLMIVSGAIVSALSTAMPILLAILLAVHFWRRQYWIDNAETRTPGVPAG